MSDNKHSLFSYFTDPFLSPFFQGLSLLLCSSLSESCSFLSTHSHWVSSSTLGFQLHPSTADDSPKYISSLDPYPQSFTLIASTAYWASSLVICKMHFYSFITSPMKSSSIFQAYYLYLQLSHHHYDHCPEIDFRLLLHSLPSITCSH